MQPVTCNLRPGAKGPRWVTDNLWSRLTVIPVLLLAMGILSIGARPVAAQGGGNRAALIVRDGDGTVTSKCVTFTEASISGEELLNRSGLSVAAKDWGVGKTVCSINGYGCVPPKDCWCKCQGATCEFWAYYHWTGGAWLFSSQGVSSYQVTDGALEGFAWGAGTYGSSGAIPPTTSFDAICVSPTATSTPTQTPSPTLTPAPSVTPRPTSTPRPSSTPTRTPIPRSTSTLTPAPIETARLQDYETTTPTATSTPMAARSPSPTVQSAATALPTAMSPTPPAHPEQSDMLTPAQSKHPEREVPRQRQSAAQSKDDAPAPVPVHIQLFPSASPTPPLVRRQVAPGQPTPTPILMARVGSRGTAQADADTASGSSESVARDNSFHMSLIPGYAVYLLMAAFLVSAGTVVVRERGGM